MSVIYYVGMDVHKAITVIMVIDSAVKEVRCFVVETKASTRVDTIKIRRFLCLDILCFTIWNRSGFIFLFLLQKILRQLNYLHS